MITRMKTNLLPSLSILLTLPLIFYLLIPAPPFPSPPPNSYRSSEPGDIQDPNIRAYFTDMDRDSLMAYYASQFKSSSFLQIPLLTLRLADYPPEESSIRIMEQIKSSYLEELVHPLRESIFINSWEPKEAKDAINVAGRHFENKVTIRYYKSSVFSRMFVGMGIGVIIYFIFLYSFRLFNSKK